MQTFYVLYFTFVAFLLAASMPESQGRWSSLCQDILSLISYTRSTTSTTSLPHRLIITNSLSAENSLSSTGGFDVCWLSPFGVHGACHPFDAPPRPTPTPARNRSATRTVSAIPPSPIRRRLVLYKDMFASQLKIERIPKKSNESKSARSVISNNVKPIGFLGMLSTVTSTVIVAQLLMVLGHPVVGYFESPNPGAFIPNGLEFHSPTVFPGCHNSLVLSWISVASSLVPTKPVSYVPDYDATGLTELPLWLLYFATTLVRSCSKPATTPPPSTMEPRTTQRLMIEAPPLAEVREVLSFHWFKTHACFASLELGEDPGVQPTGFKDEDDHNALPPILELKPAVQPHVPDVSRPSALSALNSLHLADYVDGSWLEAADPNQTEAASSTFNPETSSIETNLSHSHLSADVSESTLVRSFERVSGKRTTPQIRLEYSQVGSTCETQTPLSLLDVVSMKSLPGDCDFGLLSEFPAPPKKASARSFSLFGKWGLGASSSRTSRLPNPNTSPDPQQVRRMRLLPTYGSYSSLKSARLANPADKMEGSSPTRYRPASRASSSTPSVVVNSCGSSPPRSNLLPSASSRWSFLKKSKQNQNLKQVSSSLFASSNSSVTLHEKLSVFPKRLSHRAFGNGKRLAEPLGQHCYESYNP